MNRKTLDFIDFEKVNLLLEGFNKATGFVTAILDLEGNILSKSGWRQICTEFHRVNPETAKKCSISDTELAGKLGAGEKYHAYKCLNGLVDVAVPIIINDEHVANLFSGQFFFENPDKDFFTKQAEKYKFDNKSYLEALDQVPVVSEEKVKTTMDFLLNMTHIISEMTQQRIEQIESNNILKESEERWQFAIEENGDGLFDWNVETNHVFFSKQWKAMLGFEDDEIENKFDEWDKRVHPDDKANAYLNLQKHLEGETENYKHEHRLLCKDGSYKWILAKGKVISRNENNKPLRLLGTHRDITESKKAENKLKMFNRIINHSLNAFDIVSHEGKFIYVNQAYADMWGFETTDEIVGSSPASHCEDQNLPGRIISEINMNGKFISEIKAKRKDGSLFDVLMYARLDHDENGNEVYPTTSLDITERKQAEDELKKQKDMFELVINSVPARIFWKDLNSVYLGCNSAFAKAAGENKIENIIGKNDFDLVWGKEAKRYIDTDRNIIKTGIPKLGYDEDYTLANGEKVFWHSSKMPLKDTTGKIIGILCTSEDITERKHAEQAIKEGEFRYSELVNTINSGVAIYKVINDGKTGSDYIIQDFNKTALEIEGLIKEEVLGKRLSDIRPNIDDYGLIPIFEKVWKTGKPDFFPSKEYLDNRYANFYENQVFQLPDGNIVSVYDDVTERENTVLLVKKSQERFNLALNATKDGIYDWDLITNEIYYSPPWKSMLGYKDNELANDFTIWEKLTEKDDVARSWEMQQELINKQRDYFELEFKMKHKNGHWVDVLSRAKAVFDESGKAVRIVGTHVDITERKKSEELIVKNKSRLDYALTSIATGAWELDLVKGGSWRSFEHDKIFGYSKPLAEWTYDMFLEHVVPEDRELVNEKFQKATSTKTDWDFECRIIRKDGSTRWILGKGNHELNNGKEPTRMFGIVQDITERKQTEEEIRESKERYQSLFNNSPVPLWEEDFSEVKKLLMTLQKRKVKDYRQYLNNNPDLVRKCAQQIKITDVNNSVLKLHDAESKEELLKDLSLIIIDNSYDDFKEELIAIAEGKSECEFESKVKTLKGREKDVYLKWKVVPGYEDTLEKVYVSTMDITEREKVVQALKESEKRFKVLHNASFGGIAIHDMGIIKDCNQGFSNITGYTFEELIGMDGFLCIAEDSRKTVRQNIKTSYEKAYEIVGLRKNGEEFPLRIEAQTVPYEGKNMRIVEFRDITEQKQAEEKTRSVEENLKNTFDLSPNIICKANLETGYFIETNRAVTRILGYSVEEFTSKPFIEYIHPDDQQSTTDEKDKQIKGKEITFFQNRYLCKNGSYKWMAWHGTKADKNGITTAIGSDITEQKKAGDKLKESEEKLRLTIDNSPLGVCMNDMQGNFISTNLAYEKLIGYSKDELGKMSFFDITHPEDRPENRNLFDNMSSKSTPGFNMEKRYIRKNGSIINVLVHVGVIHDKQGMPMFGLAFVEDITDRKKAEKELSDSLIREQNLGDIVRNSPMAIATGHPDGRLDNCNEAFVELTGYTEAELKNINWNTELTPSHWNEIEAEALQKLSVKNNFIHYEKEYLHKNGSIIPVELFVYCKFDKHNKPFHYVGFVVDISERNEAKEELKKHYNMLEEVVKERTKNLEDKNKELERFNDLFVDREFRIKELRDKLKKFENE